MKKIITYALLLAMIVSMLAGCGDKKSKDKDTSTDVNTSNTDTSGTNDDVNDGPMSALDSAKAYLKETYKDKPTSTSTDFERLNTLVVGENTFKVTWTVNCTNNEITIQTKEDDPTIDIIKINVEKPEADIPYVLTATITAADGSTTELTFNYTIPAYKEMSFEDYIKAEKDETVLVKGVISAIISKSNGSSYNCLYLQGTDGGYYVYGMESDPIADLKLEIGMTVMAAGVKDIYSGTHEVKNATIEIVSTEKAEVVPFDYTEIFKNASSLKDEALVGKQGALVTIKGVEITGISAENDSYYMFKLGSLETYVRISSSTCAFDAAGKTKFIDTYKANIAKSATVTGLISVYNGNFYLVPATPDAYSDFAEIQRTDADKVAAEKEKLSVPDKFVVDKEVELALSGKTFTDVKISWASDNKSAVIKNGKLKVTLGKEEQTAKITATLTCGSATDVVEFTIALGAKGAEEKPEGTAYMFAVAQIKAGKNLYFTGAKDGNFLATSEKASDAVKVYLETVSGGYRFYFMKDGQRTYIDVYEYTAGKVGVDLTTEPTCVFRKDDKIGYITTVAGTDYYLGTYNDFTTISASKTSYITDDNIGVTQFVIKLTTSELPKIDSKPETPDTPDVPDAPTDELNIVKSPKADTAYKFALNQASKGQILYFTGEMSGFYLATTEDKSAAKDVYLESKDGGFYLYFKNGSSKLYINIVEREDAPGKQTIRLEETAKSLYKFDSTLNILITTLTFADSTETDFYFGTYSTFVTISSSKTSYISGDKAADIGVSQFPAYLVK